MLTQLDKFITARELLENGRLSLGDIVEIDRIIYSHWVLYIGGDDVVHVAGPDSDIPSSQASVIKCKLRDVAGSSLVRINNKLVPARERGFASLPCDVTVSRARGMVGTIVTHNLMTRNSEHFVTSWKYGVCWSDQVCVLSQCLLKYGWYRKKGIHVLVHYHDYYVLSHSVWFLPEQ